MANAEAALLSSTIYPEMRKDGYEDDFAACFIASVSVVGPLIPPGLLYVIYGVSSGTPIAYLFEAGVVPGIMVGLALALVIFILSRNPGRKWVIHDWQGWRHVWSKLKSAAFSIVAPFLTFVSIAAGVATATESASLIIMVVTLVGIFIYKKIKLKALIPMIIRSAVMSGAILIIAAMAGVMGWALAIEQTPPVGTCLYTTAMATKVPVDRMVKGIWPWIGVLVVCLLICTYCPDLVLAIPRLLGYTG